MAVGFSGSNGGIGTVDKNFQLDLAKRPLEVSYFVNNLCNLRCKHCYVGYEIQDGELSVQEWTDTFDRLIDLGALTFGNVGKEPLLSPDKTLDLLRHLKQKRKENPKLRFGLVTNGTLLERGIVDELAEISPDYMDVSLDGTQKEHDFIRGEGNYKRTVENLRRLPKDLAKKVFISFTLMRHNKNSFKEMVQEIGNIGLTKFLVSPYVSTPSSNGDLKVSEEDIVKWYKQIAKGQEIDFTKLDKSTILLKSDYDSQKTLMEGLVKYGVIDLRNLFIDEYGVIFNRYPQTNASEVIINYMPFSDTLSRAIRISHDGYVGGCLEMFHKDYPKRARASLREKRIEEIIG